MKRTGKFMTEPELAEARGLAMKPARIELQGSLVIQHPKAEGLLEYVQAKAKEHGLPYLFGGRTYGIDEKGEFLFKECEHKNTETISRGMTGLIRDVWCNDCREWIDQKVF